MREKAWFLYLSGCGLTLVAGAAAGETPSAIAFIAVAIATVVILVVGSRRSKGLIKTQFWNALAIAIVLFLAGGIVNEIVSASSIRKATHYPGVLEVFDGLAYMAIFYAVIRLADSRRANTDRTAMLDALISVGGLAIILWSLVTADLVTNPSLSFAGRLTTIVFALTTLTIGTLVLQVALGPGKRSRSFELLGVAALFSFLADLTVSSGTNSADTSEIFLNLISGVGIALLGAAFLHPTMPSVTQEFDEVVPTVTRRRMFAMTFAVMLPPLILVREIGFDISVDVAVVIGGWSAIVCLVLLRLVGLLRTRERVNELDQIMRIADATLATTTDTESMAKAVLEATVSMLAPARSRASLIMGDDTGWEVVMASGYRADEIEGLRYGNTDTTPHLGKPDEFPQWHMTVPLPVADGDRYMLALAADRPAPDEVHGHIESLATDLTLAIQAAAIRRQSAREYYDRRYRALVESSNDILIVLSDSVISFISPSSLRLVGRQEAELIGCRPEVLFIPEDRATLNAALTTAPVDPVELRVNRPDGSTAWLQVTITDKTSIDGINGLVITASEFTARRAAEAKLVQSEARLQSLVQHSSDLVAVLDGEGRLVWVGDSAVGLLGYEINYTDADLTDLIAPHDQPVIGELFRRVCGARPINTARSEIQLRHNDGSWRDFDITLTNLLDDPNVEGVVVNAHDITERKKLEDSLTHNAFHDDLTELPNRVLLRDRLAHAVSRRTTDNIALVIINVDDFNSLNDSLGHLQGDEILRLIAFRISSFVRAGDTAARLGGDEFAVLLERSDNPDEIYEVAERLMEAITQPIDLGDRCVTVRLSVGLSFSGPSDDMNADTIMRSADLALRSAKAAGGHRIDTFDPTRHQFALERIKLRSDLERAVTNREFSLDYQPIVNLRSGEVAGFEALLRWNHPEYGRIPPDRFIPIAEETGAIVEIGRWLFDEAFGQLAQWQSTDSRPLKMSVNLSARQLDDDRIVDYVRDAILKAGLDPSSIVLELTESHEVDEVSESVERLEAIRALGAGLYTDDFGTGFATYAALQYLPFTGVKIDRSLLTGLTGARSDVALEQLRSIVAMAHNTGRVAVVEGIETAEQAAVARSLGCDFGQGYFYGRPAPADTFNAPMQTTAPSV